MGLKWREAGSRNIRGKKKKTLPAGLHGKIGGAQRQVQPFGGFLSLAAGLPAPFAGPAAIPSKLH